MSFHGAIRRAVVARAKTDATLALKTFSLPPANFAPPLVIVGKIKFEGALTNDDNRTGFYSFAVETWAQPTSPLDLDLLSGAVLALFNGQPLPAIGVVLSPPDLVDEDDALALDAPGGAVMARTQTFRLLAQPIAA